MKFYGTLGPSCCTEERIAEMFQSGMTGMRLNLSHGGLIKSRDWINAFHRGADDVGVDADFMIDLRGPELRIGKIGKPFKVKPGDEIIFFAGETAEKQNEIPIPTSVFERMAEGQETLINDGKVEAVIRSDSGEKIRADVVRGGLIADDKSIALPGIEVPSETLTESDRNNLDLMKDFGVNQVMLPFVRGREDVDNLRKALAERNQKNVRIFAKIENLSGVQKLDDIIESADEIVIARGDLGNAVPLWELPSYQKRIAKACRGARKPFMVVTQMLDSMRHSAVPTRAEVSDVYNAVLDGASSLMLTGETAEGKYPVEAMRYLIRTARAAQ